MAFVSALSAQTTIPVTTTADNPGAPPSGSLRAAIFAANATRGSASNPITIAFAPAMIGQSINLGAALPFLTASFVTFQVPVSSPSQRVTVDAGAQLGHFFVSSSDVTFRNLTFKGGTGDSFSLYGSTRVTFERCDFVATGIAAMFAIGARDTTFRECLIDGYVHNGPGILAVDGSDQMRFENTVVRNFTSSAGIVGTGLADLVVTGCTFTNNSTGILLLEVCHRPSIGPNVTFDGNLMSGINASLTNRMTVTGCTFKNNGGAGAYIVDRCDNTLFDQCTFDRNGAGSPQIAAGNSQLVVRDCRSVTLRQTSIMNGLGVGLEALGCMGLVVDGAGSGCRMTGNRGSGIYLKKQTSWVSLENATIQGNCTQGGVQVVFDESSNVTVKGCTISGSVGWGLQTIRSSAITVTAGTRFDGNGSGALQIGTSSDVVIGPRNLQDPSEKGCVITNNGGIMFDRATNCRLNGNTALAGGECVVSGTNQAVSVTNASQDVRIGPGVRLNMNGGGGIVVTAGSVNTSIEGCALSGYTSNAVFISNASATQIRGCTLSGTSSSGVGVMIDRGEGTSLYFNVVSGHGAQGVVVQDCSNVLLGPGNVLKQNTREGLLAQKSAGLPTSVTLQSTQITNNAKNGSDAGVMCNNATVKMVNCTIAGPHRYGLYVMNAGTATVANSILWGATQADRGQSASGSTMTNSIYATQLGSAWADSANSNANPLLANVGADDVHLLPGSPAKDSGHNSPAAIALPSVDLDNEPRVQFANVDRGADEKNSTGFVGNSLDLAGAWLREPDDCNLSLTLSAPAYGGLPALLLASLAGAMNGVPLNQGALLPLEPDALTVAFAMAPEISLVPLDAQGAGSFQVTLPRVVVEAIGREITFAFTVLPTLDFASNPVVVRFYR